MSEAIKNIEKILRESNLESSLTAEAFREFADIKDQIKAQEKLICELRKENSGIKAVSTELRSKADHVDSQGEENTLKAEKLKTLALDLDHQRDLLALREDNTKTRLEDHINMVGLVFRNTELKKTVMNTVNGYKDDKDNSGYPVQYHYNHTETTNTEESEE